MPIRVICFDQYGNNCTLVERSGLVRVIIARIQADYPIKEELIRQTSFELEKIAVKYCKYAILSHTWLRSTPGEIIFHSWDKRGLPQNIRGNAKITNFCSAAALNYDVRLGWMDTVCINKESSTELDESIRSMYTWYQEAEVCIAYLADTLEVSGISEDTWFTRGWTLQELLANQHIYFYNCNWAPLLSGDLTTDHLSNLEFSPEASLSLIPPEMQYQIFTATSITPQELDVFHNTNFKVPIYRIMELAARRKVTRAEDHIYSLMGLLKVSIPVAYGEGPHNALRRMIQQIMINKHNFLDLFNHT